MANGLKVWGPQGQLWLDLQQITCRVLGLVNTTGVIYETTVDFSAPSGTTPWAFGYASNGRTVVIGIDRLNSTTGRVSYATDDGSGPILIFWGYC